MELYFILGDPKKRFNDVVVKNGVGLGFAAIGFSSHMDGPEDGSDGSDGSGLTAVGEARLIPDLSTLRRIPW